MNTEYNTIENFNKLVEKGDIEKCPKCGAYSAYAWQDVNMDVNSGLRLTNDDGFADGGERYTDDEILTNWHDVYHIGACSGKDWECGKCKTPWTTPDSPYYAYCHPEMRIDNEEN